MLERRCIFRPRASRLSILLYCRSIRLGCANIVPLFVCTPLMRLMIRIFTCTTLAWPPPITMLTCVSIGSSCSTGLSETHHRHQVGTERIELGNGCRGWQDLRVQVTSCTCKGANGWLDELLSGTDSLHAVARNKTQPFQGLWKQGILNIPLVG